MSRFLSDIPWIGSHRPLRIDMSGYLNVHYTISYKCKGSSAVCIQVLVQEALSCMHSLLV
jgi:hypothetical protein